MVSQRVIASRSSAMPRKNTAKHSLAEDVSALVASAAHEQCGRPAQAGLLGVRGPEKLRRQSEWIDLDAALSEDASSDVAILGLEVEDDLPGACLAVVDDVQPEHPVLLTI